MAAAARLVENAPRRQPRLEPRRPREDGGAALDRQRVPLPAPLVGPGAHRAEQREAHHTRRLDQTAGHGRHSSAAKAATTPASAHVRVRVRW